MTTAATFFSDPLTRPKKKYKFLVEFDGGDSQLAISYYFPNNTYQWFVKSCTKPTMKIDVTPREETTTIYNVPLASRRTNENATWNPVTVKFVNPFGFDSQNAPADNPKDLDYFFNIVMSSINPNFGGNIINCDTTKQDINNQNNIYYSDLDKRSTYTLNANEQDVIKFLKSTNNDKNTTINSMSGVKVQIPSRTAEGIWNGDQSGFCRGSNEILSVCKFWKYFGTIKIWDLSNDNNSINQSNIADIYGMGYWVLINPYIDNIEVGSHEYATDEMQEYTLSIGYDSAKYIPNTTKEKIEQIAKIQNVSKTQQA